jgi:hypothetical protein
MDRSTSFKDLSTSCTKGKYIQGRLLIDKPSRIISSHVYDNQIFLEIEWEENIDGYTPQNSEIRSSDLRTKYPYLLLAYYESKIYTRNKVNLG